ncbi:MAG TPA: cytochrome c [Phenylobacterium sp.]|nr:cytochrome c [Phenylobacterium sp.]
MRRLAPFLVLLLGACAGSGQPDPGPTPARGETLAARQCSGCHALGPVGDSPRAAAPPFRDLALRNNELALERRLSAMNGQPHYEMPRVILQPGEISDLAAYIAGSR